MTNQEQYDLLCQAAAKYYRIRAEIERQEKWLMKAGCTSYNVDIAFDAIKSVFAESEDKS